MLVGTCVLATACGAADPSASSPGGIADASTTTAGTASPVATTSSSPTSAGAFLPDPHRAVPTEPGSLARKLVITTEALRQSVKRWTTSGPLYSGRAPRRVLLQALYQQRLYRAMGRDRQLGKRTLARLPGWLLGNARDNFSAGADLYSLARSSHRHRVRVLTQRPEAPGILLRYYRRAERRFGVSWTVLAAVNFIESKFGRVRSASSAGAQGPMQFIASTWAAYGMDGDVHDPHDAIMGAANYLHASGAPHYYRRALYRYNPALQYVDAVLRYARQMRRDPSDYLEYYNWQVFVITRSGDRQLTGPGS